VSAGRKIRVLVCRGPTCGDLRGSAAIHAELVRHVSVEGLGGEVILDWQSCFGQCQKGPNVLYREAKGREDKLTLAMAALSGGVKSAMHHAVTPARAIQLLDRHLNGWGIRARPQPPPAAAAEASVTTNHDKKQG
jgi:(2Fe-2S) ferredoxin